MELIYAILLCLTQLELLVVLALQQGGRGERRRRDAGTDTVSQEEAELEQAWRDTMSQLMAYSADTARRAAGGDGE